jgi:type I restriction enzyme R subunit
MFVCSIREIGYNFYKNVIALKPEWAEVSVAEEGVELTDKAQE